MKRTFLPFFLSKGKKVSVSCETLENLEEDELVIMMCRALRYHNSATAILKGKNKKAIFIGCINHSLNLCGTLLLKMHLVLQFLVLFRQCFPSLLHPHIDIIKLECQ